LLTFFTFTPTYLNELYLTEEEEKIKKPNKNISEKAKVPNSLVTTKSSSTKDIKVFPNRN
jgi:hypothetical protein